jgi:hypothetical protein
MKLILCSGPQVTHLENTGNPWTTVLVSLTSKWLLAVECRNTRGEKNPCRNAILSTANPSWAAHGPKPCLPDVKTRISVPATARMFLARREESVVEVSVRRWGMRWTLFNTHIQPGLAYTRQVERHYHITYGVWGLHIAATYLACKVGLR